MLIPLLSSLTLLVLKFIFPTDFSALWVVAPILLYFFTVYVLDFIRELVILSLNPVQVNKDVVRSLFSNSPDRVQLGDVISLSEYRKKKNKAQLRVISGGLSDDKDIS